MAATAVPSSFLFAQAEPPSSSAALKQLTLEQLMDIEVTSVSRTGEPAWAAAAAVTVVSNEDIRRSGARSVPEALRLVPGIHVGRRNSNSWAISSRGFSSVTSEKLLVLSDTRSIYTPLFSGVLWDVQDHLLQDIERIEVIRGPGAALWGSNAVNGVINITTKSARDTQGLHLEAGAGTEERAMAAARYGGRQQRISITGSSVSIPNATPRFIPTRRVRTTGASGISAFEPTGKRAKKTR